jgi:molybdopterin-biosynthesis enzyme MoeA-like protein
MFEGIGHRLVGGAPVLSRTIRTGLGEGTLAEDLSRLQDAFPDIQIGSYPSMAATRAGVRIVLRSVDSQRLAKAAAEAIAMVGRLGGAAEELDITS